MRLEQIKRSMLLVFLAAASYAADPDTIVLRDFRPGLQTESDSSAIADTASPDLLNVDVEDGSIKTRGGSVAVSSSALGGYSSQAVRLLDEYIEPDGDRWLMSASSATIFKSNNGGQDNSVLTSTHGFTTSSEYCSLTAFGKWRLTDGTTNWITWDGANVGVSTTAPHGLTCAFFAERVWTSTGSILSATNTDDVEDWTDSGLVDSDALQIPIRAVDGQGITCLKAFKDRLLIFKAKSLDAAVRNSDGLTFDIVSVSNHVGTSHCNSVVEREGDVAFLGPDAFYKYQPGTAAYKGYAGEVLRISDIIEPTVQSIQQLDANSTFHIETGQSDFEAGTLTQMSAAISAGDIVLSSWTATDDSDADFNAFSSSSSVNVVSNRIYLSTNNTNIQNNSLESGTGGTPDDWGCGAPEFTGACRNASADPANAKSGDYYLSFFGSSVDAYIKVLDSSDNELYSSSYPYTSTYSQKTIPLSSYAGRMLKIKLFVHQPSTGNSFTVATSTLFMANGTDMTFWIKRDAGDSQKSVDLFEGGRSSISSGTFTGQARNTTFPSAAWIATTPTYTENGHSVTWQTQSSANGSSWDSAVSWTPGSPPASTFRQYIRYVATFSTTSSGLALPFVETVPLAARSSTGTYQGAHFATDVTSFGSVDITETLNSGQTAYAIYTDTDTSASFGTSSTWISSQTITDGAVPTLTPSNYAFFRASATITAGTQNPTISELSLALTGGNQAPVWSEFHLGSYLTALSTSSTSGNDSILLYDRNAAWTMYDHDFYSMKRILSGSILGGSNSDGKIYRFRDSALESDNGSGINAYWRSKDFDFGIPLGNKTMERYYVTGRYKTNSDAVFSYGVNRGSATTATLDLDSTAGFFRKMIAPTSLTYKSGIQHYFKISNSDADDSFVIDSVGMKPRKETEP